MSNLIKFPAQVFCYREVQTVRSICSRTGLKLVLVLFNILIIKIITYKTPSGRETAGRQDLKNCCAVYNTLNASKLQPSGRTAPNFPISAYRNTKNENSQNYFQPKTRCRCAGFQFNALKVLKTLGFNTAHKTLWVVPCGAV